MTSPAALIDQILRLHPPPGSYAAGRKALEGFTPAELRRLEAALRNKELAIVTEDR